METIAGGHNLACHPDSPARAVSNVSCSFVWRGAGEWAFDFIIDAPPGALLLPPAAEPGRADGLWRHTCVELFLLDPASGAYLEFNFSPSGQWAAYRFDAYRAGRRALEVATPRIFTTDPAQYALAQAAQLRALGLNDESIRSLIETEPPQPAAPATFGVCAQLEDPGLQPETAWRAGLAAIIEEADGTVSYWALTHPPGDPDFHHEDCFALELPPAPAP